MPLGPDASAPVVVVVVVVVAVSGPNNGTEGVVGVDLAIDVLGVDGPSGLGVLCSRQKPQLLFAAAAEQPCFQRQVCFCRLLMSFLFDEC